MKLLARHKKNKKEYKVHLINFVDDTVIMSRNKKAKLHQLKNVELFADGETSDGHHTFNELYMHRMHMFAVLCRVFKDHAWKSRLHHDGTMYDDYFIIGLDTPEGQFTYHYHIDNWDLFDAAEVDRAPRWDGHVSADVVRLHSLSQLRMEVDGK